MKVARIVVMEKYVKADARWNKVMSEYSKRKTGKTYKVRTFSKFPSIGTLNSKYIRALTL